VAAKGLTGRARLAYDRRAMASRVDPALLVDPAHYARSGYPHDTWTRLRAEAPVTWLEPPGRKPFWAVTRHADIARVSTDPQRFISGKGILASQLRDPGMAREVPPTMVITMDPPRHGPMRRLASLRFTPRALRQRRGDIERIAVEILDQLAAGGERGVCDFVERVAAPLPIAVIAWILGVPRSDWPLLFRWTNEVVGSEDPEYRRSDEAPAQTSARARRELHAYFARLIEARRSSPEDDLVSQLAHTDCEGQELTPIELLAYCEIMVEAGNETTRNAISGGMLAFCEHPGEWEKLRARPELLPLAVEEILRWTSPIIAFARTASADCELRGEKIRAGDQLALFYPSANRDEDVFDEPFAFRVDRDPNRHLAFGIGEHFCLGAHVARVELETVFRHLLGRLSEFELAGPVERLRSATVGGIKHLPLRYRLAASSR
jgi:cytochrome P450